MNSNFCYDLIMYTPSIRFLPLVLKLITSPKINEILIACLQNKKCRGYSFHPHPPADIFICNYSTAHSGGALLCLQGRS